MQITKMTETVRKHAELAEKVAANTATDAERAEMAQLAAAIKAATTPPPPAKTRLAAMTKTQFEAYVRDEMAAMTAAPDAARLALLKRNVTEVETQATDGAEMFAVELPIVQKVDPQAALLARIEELEKKFDQRLTTGVGEVKPAEPKATAPEAAAATTPDPAAPAEGTEKTEKTADAGDDLEQRVATLKAQLAEAEAELEKKGKAFPGAAPPFGADGKPMKLGPDGKPMTDKEIEAACAGGAGGKKVKKDDEDDTDDGDQGEVTEWGDLAKAATPKDSNAAYRMLKGAHRA